MFARRVLVATLLAVLAVSVAAGASSPPAGATGGWWETLNGSGLPESGPPDLSASEWELIYNLSEGATVQDAVTGISALDTPNLSPLFDHLYELARACNGGAGPPAGSPCYVYEEAYAMVKEAFTELDWPALVAEQETASVPFVEREAQYIVDEGRMSLAELEAAGFTSEEGAVAFGLATRAGGMLVAATSAFMLATVATEITLKLAEGHYVHVTMPQSAQLGGEDCPGEYPTCLVSDLAWHLYNGNGPLAGQDGVPLRYRVLEYCGPTLSTDTCASAFAGNTDHATPPADCDAATAYYGYYFGCSVSHTGASTLWQTADRQVWDAFGAAEVTGGVYVHNAVHIPALDIPWLDGTFRGYYRWLPAGIGVPGALEGPAIGGGGGGSVVGAGTNGWPSTPLVDTSSSPNRTPTQIATAITDNWAKPETIPKIKHLADPHIWPEPTPTEPTPEPCPGCPPPDAPEPTATDWTMPNCTGMTPDLCESEITFRAGIAHAAVPTITRVELPTDGADVTKPAGAVVTTDPGAFVSGQPSTVTLNDNPDPLPLLLPAPELNETYDHYLARLRAIGWVGTATVAVLDTADPAVGPDAVSTVQVPRPAGSATPVRTLSPATWPTPLPRVKPDDPITFKKNPTTSEPVPEPPGGTPAAPPGGCGGYLTASFNLTPLTQLDVGTRFPFGVFGYLYGIVEMFNVDPVTPSFDFQFDHIGGNPGTPETPVPGGGHYEHDLSVFDPYMATIRLLLAFMVWVGGLWWLATHLLGFKAAGDLGDGFDEAYE